MFINYIKKWSVLKMPVITIAGNPGISVENKRKMVKKVSEAVA